MGVVANVEVPIAVTDTTYLLVIAVGSAKPKVPLVELLVSLPSLKARAVFAVDDIDAASETFCFSRIILIGRNRKRRQDTNSRNDDH